MSNQQDDNGPLPVVAAVAAIICGFAGYDAGQWPGAIIAAIFAFGGVFLLFSAIVLGLRLAIAGGILFFMIIALKSRWEWLQSLFQ